jgi:hypothetical protein
MGRGIASAVSHQALPLWSKFDTRAGNVLFEVDKSALGLFHFRYMCQFSSHRFLHIH